MKFKKGDRVLHKGVVFTFVRYEKGPYPWAGIEKNEVLYYAPPHELELISTSNSLVTGDK